MSTSTINQWRLCFLLITTLSTLNGCGDADPVTSPPPTEPEISTIYQERCSACHGERGEGGVGKALDGPHIDDMSDAQLFMMIYDGIGTAMPSFKSILTSEQIARIVEYIRTL